MKTTTLVGTFCAILTAVGKVRPVYAHPGAGDVGIGAAGSGNGQSNSHGATGDSAAAGSEEAVDKQNKAFKHAPQDLAFDESHKIDHDEKFQAPHKAPNDKQSAGDAILDTKEPAEAPEEAAPNKKGTKGSVILDDYDPTRLGVSAGEAKDKSAPKENGKDSSKGTGKESKDSKTNKDTKNARDKANEHAKDVNVKADSVAAPENPKDKGKAAPKAPLEDDAYAKSGKTGKHASGDAADATVNGKNIGPITDDEATQEALRDTARDSARASLDNVAGTDGIDASVRLGEAKAPSGKDSTAAKGTGTLDSGTTGSKANGIEGAKDKLRSSPQVEKGTTDTKGRSDAFEYPDAGTPSSLEALSPSATPVTQKSKDPTPDPRFPVFGEKTPDPSPELKDPQPNNQQSKGQQSKGQQSKDQKASNKAPKDRSRSSTSSTPTKNSSKAPPTTQRKNGEPNDDSSTADMDTTASDVQRDSDGKAGDNESQCEKFLAAAVMIVASELGDKTFFIAALMAMRYSPWFVFSSSYSAMVVMTVLSLVLGLILPSLLSQRLSTLIAALLFLIFGINLIREAVGMDKNLLATDEMDEVEQDIEMREKARLNEKAEGGGQAPQKSKVTGLSNLVGLVFTPVWIQIFAMTFLGEWGDRSQVATVAMGSGEGWFQVLLGCLLGHFISTVIAIMGGKILARHLSLRTITFSGAACFLMFAVIYFHDWLSQ